MLTQVERDLNQYAQEKTYKLILDVTQSFSIAGESRNKAVACLGATLLRVAATLAVAMNADREHWLTMCNEVYNQAQQAKKENDDD